MGRARLTVVRQGAGGRPRVVFLHAGICDHRSWGGVLDLLSPDLDVAAYDRRGFGTTSYQDEQHDQVAFAGATDLGMAIEQQLDPGRARFRTTADEEHRRSLGHGTAFRA